MSRLITSQVNEVNLQYTRQEFKFPEKITTAEGAYRIFKKVIPGIDVQEYFVVFLLNRQHKINGYSIVSKGGVSSTIADMRLILLPAILSLSEAIITAHNHPSGNLNPSEADLRISENIEKACDIFDINYLDNLICTRESFKSTSR